MTHHSPIATTLPAKARRYLAGQLPFRAFYAWFTAATWDIHRREPAAAPLVYAVELLIAEYTSRHRTEAELREGLERVLAAATEGSG